jgi:NTE family protein
MAAVMPSPDRPMLARLLQRLPGFRTPAKRALVLAGGGVVGGMYEVGALAALDEALPDFRANQFDLYVGSSAGAVVAALMANQVRPLDLYAILDEERDEPLNFHRGSVYHKGSFGIAARNFGRLVWAVGKKAITLHQLEWPDILARRGDDMPSGFFSLAPFEAYVREALKAKGLSNSFRECPRPLLVPAIDLDRAERVVFGTGAFVDLPISQAIAAFAAIPGFFEPYRIDGHDYIDGDVGHTGHADLAVDRGASVLVVLNPAVPQRVGGSDESAVRHRGMYAVMEQAGHITSIKLLELGLLELRLRHPEIEVHVIQPDPVPSPLRLVDGLRGEPRRPALRLHLGEGLPRRRGRRAPPPPLRRPRRLGARRRNPARAMRRVQLRGGARRQPARRTFCTLSRLSRAPTKQMGSYHRSSGGSRRRWCSRRQ